MIQAALVINTSGLPRLIKFYNYYSEQEQQERIRECFELVHKRTPQMCNFLDAGKKWGKDTKFIYRNYATLYFIFCVDSAESELAIMDLIQTFVECLDACFHEVAEIDLVFNMDKVHYLLDEVITGGIVLTSDHEPILSQVRERENAAAKDDPLATFKGDLKGILDKFSKRKN